MLTARLEIEEVKLVSLQGDHGNWPIQRTDKNLKRKK
jgi:hypothetical protein